MLNLLQGEIHVPYCHLIAIAAGTFCYCGSYMQNLIFKIRFEAGTPAIGEAVGFDAAIDYLSQIGMQNIHEYEVSIYFFIHLFCVEMKYPLLAFLILAKERSNLMPAPIKTQYQLVCLTNPGNDMYVPGNIRNIMPPFFYNAKENLPNV